MKVLITSLLGSFVFISNAMAIDKIELTEPPIDYYMVDRIWTMLKRETGAPSDLLPPPLVLDWNMPQLAKMAFQYPTNEYPDNRIQISVAPRTIDLWSRDVVSWGVGHEYLHYLWILEENGWRMSGTFETKRKHHCNGDFMAITNKVADLIWSVYHDGQEQSTMYKEAHTACRERPNQ
jgi:hypothetical protein